MHIIDICAIDMYSIDAYTYYIYIFIYTGICTCIPVYASRLNRTLFMSDFGQFGNCFAARFGIFRAFGHSSLTPNFRGCFGV